MALVDQLRCKAKVFKYLYYSFIVDVVKEALYVKEEQAHIKACLVG